MFFFSCLITAEITELSLAKTRASPKISLKVVIFGHIYCPNILETKKKIPLYFYECLMCLKIYGRENYFHNFKVCPNTLGV